MQAQTDSTAWFGCSVDECTLWSNHLIGQKAKQNKQTFCFGDGGGWELKCLFLHVTIHGQFQHVSVPRLVIRRVQPVDHNYTDVA